MANKIGDKRVLEVSRWSDSNAATHTYWLLQEWRKPKFRKARWCAVMGFVSKYRLPVTYYRKSDALAVAKHYGTKITKE